MKITEKLSIIQAELKSPKNQFNKFGKYKYRNCEDILEALKPHLKSLKCIVTLSDSIHQIGEFMYVQATASIQDGEDAISVQGNAGIDPNQKGMQVSQSFGSSSSYARKYALNGLFAIDDTKDADTEKPVDAKIATTKKVEPKLEAASESVEPLANKQQKEALGKHSNNELLSKEQSTNLLKLSKNDNLTENQFHNAIQYLGKVLGDKI